MLDHLVRRQTRQGTMWSEAIILFLKQPDFFFRVLERKKPIDVQALIAMSSSQFRYRSKMEKIGEQLVFKGGTSLSKVFGVIERFSEDIDLSVSPDFVGIKEEWGGGGR